MKNIRFIVLSLLLLSACTSTEPNLTLEIPAQPIQTVVPTIASTDTDTPTPIPAPTQTAIPAANTFCQNVTEIPQIECEALIAIQQQAVDAINTYPVDTWVETLPPCSWSGIICTGQHVTELHLEATQLSSLPGEIGNFADLTSLRLENATLSSLPPEISNLSNLNTLSLWGNQFSRIPPEIFSLSSLTELNLGSNQLSSLPPDVGELPKLAHLDLSFNQLSSLPPEIGHLNTLNRLELWGNQLSSLPPEINSLTNLRELNLGNNQFTNLPLELISLTSIKELNLGNNQLSNLPPEIGSLIKLEKLYLSTNQVNSLPPEIGSLSNLVAFELVGNQLGALPPEIGSLTNLTALNLGDNQLSSLPPEIGHLRSLNTFELWGNQLSSLPPEIGNLTNLARLNVSNNRLNNLPPEIGSLANLTYLGLENNQLSSLPPEIGSLSGLTELPLYGNQLDGLSTPEPTHTATSVPTMTPTQVPPPTMTPEPLAKLPHNLLFIENGAIYQLNKQTQQREMILASDQIPTSETEDGRQPVAISRFIVTADAQRLVVESQRLDHFVNLDVFSVSGEWLYQIAQGIEPLIELVASPNNETILYIPQETGVNAGPIMMRQLEETAVSQQIAYCEPDPDPRSHLGCKGVQWSPDNRFIIGQDGQGVWRISVSDRTFSRVLNHDLPEDGLDTEFERYFLYRVEWQAGQYWSPSGRYARIWVNRIEGAGHQAVLDMETMALITVPESGAYDFPGPTFVWLPDDRLLMVRPSPDYYEGATPTDIEIWYIDPQSQQFILDQKIEAGAYVAGDPVYQRDGRVLFHSSGKQPTDSNLWTIQTTEPLSLDPEALTQLDRYDNCGKSAYWSADGEVGFFQSKFVPVSAFIPDQQQWLNLHFYVSPEATNLYWLE